MLRIQLTLVVLFFMLCAAVPSSIADGVYIEEGIGSSQVDDQLGEIYQGQLVVRLALGARVDNISGGVFFSATMLERGPGGGASDLSQSATLLRYGPEMRYFIPVNKRLRLYGRGGLSQNRLVGVSTEMRGRGVEWGAGAIYSTKVRALGFLAWPLFFTSFGPKVSTSFWADAGGHFARLRDEERRTLDVRTASWSLGFTLGGDF